MEKSTLKATGIVRQVDELGRVTLPRELRRTLGIDVKDPLEIYTNGDKIILKKYVRGCIFCGELRAGELVKYKGNAVCHNCVTDMMFEAFGLELPAGDTNASADTEEE